MLREKVGAKTRQRLLCNRRHSVSIKSTRPKIWNKILLPNEMNKNQVTKIRQSCFNSRQADGWKTLQTTLQKQHSEYLYCFPFNSYIYFVKSLLVRQFVSFIFSSTMSPESHKAQGVVIEEKNSKHFEHQDAPIIYRYEHFLLCMTLSMRSLKGGTLSNFGAEYQFFQFVNTISVNNCWAQVSNHDLSIGNHLLSPWYSDSVPNHSTMSTLYAENLVSPPISYSKWPL